MPGRTKACPPGFTRERLRKAAQFWRVADDAVSLAADPADVSNAATSLLVDCGIAAADVVCCVRLGVFSQEKDHHQAERLLERADAELAPHLATLLGMKSKASYTHVSISDRELKQARRAAEQLLDAARRIAGV